MSECGEGVPNIVVPTIRPEKFKEFLNHWSDEFKGCHLIVVEDNPVKTLTYADFPYNSFTYEHYSWKEIDKELGKKAWIIPRRSDCVRSFGYYKAWKNKASFIVTLDDDTRPGCKGHIQAFYNKLFLEKHSNPSFYNTMKPPHLPRGTYKGLVGCDVVHGGWLGTPDYSAEEQVKSRSLAKVDRNDFNEGLIPEGAPFSMCGMNLAWKTEHTPTMYFGLQGNIMIGGGLAKLPIDRCGDIWCGYNVSKEGLVVYHGEPFCIHERASNVWNNMKKEENAEWMSDWYLREGADVDLDDSFPEVGYWRLLREAEEEWKNLFQEQ